MPPGYLIRRLQDLLGQLINPAIKELQGKGFDIELALGNITGKAGSFSFGRNPVINNGITADIWDFGPGITPVNNVQEMNIPSDAGKTLYISSDNASDTGIPIVLTARDTDFNATNPVVTLNGQTKTIIPGGAITRVLSALHGGYLFANNTEFQGNVYIYEDDTLTDGTPNTPTKVYGKMFAINQGTQSSLYTTPLDKTALIPTAAFSVPRGIDGTLCAKIRLFGGVWWTFPCYELFESFNEQNLGTYLTLPEKADFKYSFQSNNDGARFSISTGIIEVDD